MTNRSRVAFSVTREHRSALPEQPPKDAGDATWLDDAVDAAIN